MLVLIYKNNLDHLLNHLNFYHYDKFSYHACKGKKGNGME